jgi:hypothetical protein
MLCDKSFASTMPAKARLRSFHDIYDPSDFGIFYENWVQQLAPSRPIMKLRWIFLFYYTALCQVIDAANTPSPDLLMSSWRLCASNLSAKDHYQIEGIYHHRAYLGRTATDDYRWSVRHDHNRYHWIFDRSSNYSIAGRVEASYDGTLWYSYMGTASTSKNVVNQMQIWSDPILKLGEPIEVKYANLAGFKPFDLEHFFSDPLLQGIHLPDELLSRVHDLDVSGQESLNGENCYVLTWKANKIPGNNYVLSNKFFLPAKVYFAEKNHRFTPVAFTFFASGYTLKIHYLEGVLLDGDWVPTSYTTEGEDNKSHKLVDDQAKITTLRKWESSNPDDFVIHVDKSVEVYDQRTHTFKKPSKKFMTSWQLPTIAIISCIFLIAFLRYVVVRSKARYHRK